MAVARLLTKVTLGSMMCLLLLSACALHSSQLTTHQQVLEASGLLRPGEHQTEILPIGDVLSVTITVFSDQPNLLTNVSDPHGDLVASAETSDRPLEDIPSSEGTYSARMKLNRPADGTWQIQMHAGSETWYVIIVEAETSTILDVRTDRPRYLTDSPINVTARLFRGQALLSGGAIRGELRQGSESIQVVDLSETDDGIFRTQFAPVNEAMRPDLLITATNGTVQRQIKVPLVIIESSARILGVRSEQLLDTDNDKEVDQLIIDVQLDVKRAGRYTLAAHLESQEGEPIAYAEHNTAIRAALRQGNDTLSPGQLVISLSFSGQEIYDHGIDGPYSVRLILYDTDQAGAEVDASEYVTWSYSANDFR